VRIRSVTIGTNLGYPLDSGEFCTLETFQRTARSRFENAGYEVQTTRLATQPFPLLLRDRGAASAPRFARELQSLCQEHGLDYCSIGPVLATDTDCDLSFIDVIPAVIQATDAVFASVLVASQQAGINLQAIARCAGLISEIAHLTPDGFGNLRLAVLADCGPGSPFFPVAYHQAPETGFTIATEAADLAVKALTGVTGLAEANQRLVDAIEHEAEAIEQVCRSLEADFGFAYGGIDFSLAPFPVAARSIGQAIEGLGIDRFGGSGTLFAVALIKQAIEKADFTPCGFCGVMLPVLEDHTLAHRTTEDLFTIDSLLLYSSVCGTGLDTIPLPGDVEVEELAGILLDVATLSLVCEKPLTARLMPIPGKKAGEMTDFDFAYFANAQIMSVRGCGAPRVFERNNGLTAAIAAPHTVATP
jgi:hypothetical protein